jgi:hypothetical protein
LQVWGANARTDICDVANSASLHTGSRAEEQERAFLDFRSTGRSPFENAFPSIKIITSDHVRNLNAGNKAAERNMTPAALPG